MLSFLKTKVIMNLEPPKLETIQNGAAATHQHQYLFSPLPIDHSSDDFPTTAPCANRHTSMSISCDSSMDLSSNFTYSRMDALENYLYDLSDVVFKKHKSDKVERIISQILNECEDALLRYDDYKDICDLPILELALGAMKYHPKVKVVTGAMTLLGFVILSQDNKAVLTTIRYVLTAMRVKHKSTNVQEAGAELLGCILEFYGPREEIFICFSAEGGVELMVKEQEKCNKGKYDCKVINATLVKVENLTYYFQQTFKEMAMKTSNTDHHLPIIGGDGLLKLHVDLVQFRLTQLGNNK